MSHETHPAENATTVLPELSAEEQDALFRVAAERVVQAVVGRKNEPMPELPESLAERPLYGAFVSLKRGGKLRSCCGQLGDAIPLYQALDGAAVRAALDDPRFPPIAVEELGQLDMEVWLLADPQPILAKGRDRAKAIEIGRHGLQIARGNAKGLLLPGVAVEHGYDAETFLEQVCRKAGLPTDAWLDDDTQLWTFEGISIRRPLASAIPNHIETVGPDTDDLEKLAAFALQNVEAMTRGAVANSYLAGAFDGQVQGVVFTLADEDTTVAEVARFDPRNDMPLQATLFELCKAAAAAARTRRIAADRLPQLRADLAVVWNPRLLGKASETQLAGVDPNRYALAAVLRDRWTLVVDPDRNAESLRETALERLRSPDGSSAMLYALQFAATRTPVTIGNTARPMLGNAIRPPAVAGTFYPADPQEINAALKELFSEPARPEKHAAAMLPHAGWIYSGKVAAAVLNRLEIPERVIIVCPKHSRVGADWAVAPHATWALPLVSVQSDPELAERIAAEVPNMTLDGLAHVGEHAIEVLLPLIAARNPSTKVVGIAITSGSYATLQEAGKKLAEVVASYDPPPLLLISSDMSHYRDDASTRKDDREALDAMASLDPRRLYETVIGNSITMCGIRPAVLIMETLKAMGKLNRMEEVAYATSAEVSGDTRRVFGYAGVLFD